MVVIFLILFDIILPHFKDIFPHIRCSMYRRLILGVLKVNSGGTEKMVAAMINQNTRLLCRLEDNISWTKTI